jgi:hypothetical protein
VVELCLFLISVSALSFQGSAHECQKPEPSTPLDAI